MSKENNFAFGFFSPGSSNYRYLGIWYHKVSEKTVVWVANRNNPINGSSGFLSINQHGNLVLYGENGPVWWTNVSVKTTANFAQILDSGKLVLLQGDKENKKILWQSFDHPTNTLLPGMKIGLNKKTGQNWFLTSWKSENDPGIGKYSFKLNPNGSPQIFLYEDTKLSWRTNPWPWAAFQDVYNCNFVNNQDEISYSCSFYDTSIIAGSVLENSGILKWLTWDENDAQWKVFLSFPSDRCDSYGGCGVNGMCDSKRVNRLECSCLPGYEPKSLSDWRGGCLRKRNESSVCGNGEGFVKVESLKLPDTSAAVWLDKRMSQIECEEECKRNCYCTAYSSIFIDGKGSSCLTWYGELIDTIKFMPDNSYDLYVRVDAVELASSNRGSNSFLHNKGMLSILIVSVSSAWLVIIIFVYFWLKTKKKKRKKRKIWKERLFDPVIVAADEFEDGSRSYSDLVLYDLSTIIAATHNFSTANKIGQGGFGNVYKGQLSNGQEIAIKRMSRTSMQGVKEFANEVMLIAKLQHRNLVKLLGCCIEKQEQMLIYEYLPNRSLDTFLFDERKRSLMNWERRFNIIVGIAGGILYLHHDSRLTIIHRDLKSSNILLDVDMNPKISDFGLAKLFKNDQFQDKTNRIVGTYGYMSPEYAVFGKFSIKSDIFSFGVILLEIISGKKSNGFNDQDTSICLIGQVWELWKEDKPLEIVDPSLEGSYNFDQVLRCIQVGLLCVQEDAMDRPTMLAVMLMLRSESTLPSPKQPAFIFRASSNNGNSLEAGKDGPCSINDLTISAVLTR